MLKYLSWKEVRTVNRKRWQIMPIDQELILQCAQELNIDPHAVLLAYTRGIDDICDMAEFFGIEAAEEVDPFLFPDMAKAAERVRKAVDDFESIAVYGDYDVDGVTATALLYLYLSSLGANVSYYIPDRHTEGYGLSCSAADKLKERGVNLIVTVDNGISALEEAKYIKKLGMDLVITDHHLPGDELPEAEAVVDPHREDCPLEFKDYVGAGVAYKLMCAVEGEINEKTESYMDLVALGTVADVMPLLCENRNFVKRGLDVIASSPRIGIKALRKAAGTDEKVPSSSELAFALSPRINAAGRMGSAERGLKLLISTDPSDAQGYAEEISEENALRQKTEQEITALAIEQIESAPGRVFDPVLVVDGEGWNDGVIGIVASRLTERYGRPSVVITKLQNEAKGSGRSVEGFSLYDALDAVKDKLTHFGGHKLAAGLGIDPGRIDEFRKAINAYAQNFDMPFSVQRIDYKLKLHSINEELLAVAETMEPCGAGNPQPVFGIYNMTIDNIVPIGSGKHIKLELSRNGSKIYALKFSCTAAEFPYEKGDVVDLAVAVKRNEYLGRVSVSIIIKNIRMHGIDEESVLKDMRLYEKFERGSDITAEEASYMMPDRKLNIDVYRFIRSRAPWRFGTEILCHRIKESRYAPVCCCIEAMKESGLIIAEKEALKINENSGKVSLEDTPVIKRLKTFAEGNKNEH